MDDVTRHELDARCRMLKAEMDVHFAQARSQISTRFGELETKMQSNGLGLIKWMIGIAIATIVITVSIVSMLLHTIALAAPDTASVTRTTSLVQAGKAAVRTARPVRLLDRLQRHHQP